MRQPLFNVSTLMVAVGVVAADCWALSGRSYALLPRTGTDGQYLWLDLPLLSAAAVGGFALAVQVARRGESDPTLLGFVATACFAVLLLLFVEKLDRGKLDAYFDVVKWALHRVLKFTGLIVKDVDYYDPPWRYLAAPALVGTVLVIPFFAFALISGRLFQRAGLVIMRRPQ